MCGDANTRRHQGVGMPPSCPHVWAGNGSSKMCTGKFYTAIVRLRLFVWLTPCSVVAIGEELQGRGGTLQDLEHRRRGSVKKALQVSCTRECTQQLLVCTRAQRPAGGGSNGLRTPGPLAPSGSARGQAAAILAAPRFGG